MRRDEICQYLHNDLDSRASLVMLYETHGDDWGTPELFCFGVITPANDVVMQIAKLTDVNCQGSDYFSQP